MKNQQLSVLFLGGARRVSLAELLIRSGERIGYKVNILSYDLSEEVPISTVGKVIKGLRWNDPGVVSDIERVVKEFDINIILPFVNGAIEIASICRDKMPDVFVPVTDFDTACKLFDKTEAAKVFKEAGLPIPRTYSVLSAQMPAIAKPRKGGSSRGIHIFNNMEDLMHLQDLPNYLVQEYIPNCKEYTVDCYISGKGEILTTVPRERIEIMGGESTRTRTCRNEILENLSREVIEKFSLRGPVNLQFLHDIDADRYLLMEVNPRLGGGVICSIYAGAPITDYIINEALGVELAPCDDWASGTLMARYFKEAIFYERD
ncbi:MAG: ATP-grasp domain-containing protein [Muribaculaceae bacterium]|nr:ATP-grasp domain-containing protein [Muribaculaceae bacterium]MDE5713057.1 ATP-grasp domain-containing protein [Muribaculaceae bacterium]